MGLLDLFIQVAGGGLHSRNTVRRRPHTARHHGSGDKCMDEVRNECLADRMDRDEAETVALTH